VRYRRAGDQDQNPDQAELEAHRPALGLQHRADHDQAQANVIRFRDCVQAREDIRQAQQAKRACQKEETSDDHAERCDQVN
jgi:hypothetical protein